MAMRTWMTGLASSAVVGGALLIGAGSASAQHHHHHHPGAFISGDLSRVVRDEARLDRDFRQLERDAANGNVVGEFFDVLRIQQDQANLARDQQQLYYDVNDAGYYNGGYYNGGYSNQTANTLIPSPTNPGYFYYPNNPGQLYYYPNQQPIQQQQVVAPTNPAPQGVGSISVNPPPQVLQTVRISNPASTGVELSFVFGGKPFTVESGTTKEFMVTTPTLIVFSRGGQLGEARYTLTGGNTFEFRYDDAGWSMMQKRREQTAAKSTDALALTSNPPPRYSVPQQAPAPVQP